MSGLVGRALVPAAARLLHLRDAGEAALPSGPLLRPVTGGGFGHYNVVIPDLPEPHRFLGCAVFIGRPGVRVFDIDHAVAGSPRTTATLAFGTAATAPDWFAAYSTRDDCDLRPDGSHLRFGDDLLIAGEFPCYRVSASRPGLVVDLELECTGQIVWFARSRIYRHYGLPARYRGSISRQGRTQRISGVLSLEYAWGRSATTLADRRIPGPAKLPCDFFTYHVLCPSPDTLLLLTHIEALGRPLLTTAYDRPVDEVGNRYVDGVEFEILALRDEPAVAPDGALMRVPAEFRWRAPQGTEVVGRPDTALIYGLGRGWFGGYRYAGRYRGTPIQGRAYFEYVDVRSGRPGPAFRSRTRPDRRGRG